MNKIARAYLYLQVFCFSAIGLTSLFAPHMMVTQMQLAPVSIAGTGEFRSLYGGGFLGFALVLLGGLRCKPLSSGLLISMATVMGGVVVGRVVSICLDHEYMTTPIVGILELLITLACWRVYQHDKAARTIT